MPKVSIFSPEQKGLNFRTHADTGEQAVKNLLENKFICESFEAGKSYTLRIEGGKILESWELKDGLAFPVGDTKRNREKIDEELKKKEIEEYQKYIHLLTESISEDKHYLTVPNIDSMERSFNKILQKVSSGCIGSLKEYEINFVEKLFNLRGRSEIKNALQQEISKEYHSSILNSINSTSNQSNSSNLAPLIAGSALLINQGVKNIGEDVESISEGFGFDL